jgi:hypothetical protein
MIKHLQTGHVRKSDKEFTGAPVVFTGPTPCYSKRKARLLGCACCRLEWSKIKSDACRWSVEAAEKIADGLLAWDDLGVLSIRTDARADGCTEPNCLNCSAQVVSDSNISCIDAPWFCPEVCPSDKCHALRDIFGSPFHPVGDHVDWCSNKSHTQVIAIPHCESPGWMYEADLDLITDLAQAAYDDRSDTGKIDQYRLLVLADALEENGCSVGQVFHYKDDATEYWSNSLFPSWPHLTPERAGIHPFLEHLRSPLPHFRGCWVLDKLLGKA